MECRRSLLLAHFGEAWDPARCQRTCDVCVQRGQLAFQQVSIAADITHGASYHLSKVYLSGHILPAFLQHLDQCQGLKLLHDIWEFLCMRSAT